MAGTGARSVHPALRGLTASAALLWGQAVAFAGPCTEQIAQLQAQVAASAPAPLSAPVAGVESGATDTQSVGAQLHHQPTPGSVAQAEHPANADGTAALDRARKADAAGDAAGCNQAAAEARRIYAIKD